MKYTRALGLALTLLAAPSAVAQVGGDAGGGGTASDGGAATGASVDASGGGSAGLSGNPLGSQGGGGGGDFQVTGPAGPYGPQMGSYGAYVAGDVNAIINEGTPNSLEEALERAIKRNPEIALAAANRRQAEMAENLTKNKVFGSVVETYKQWQFDLQALKSAEARQQAATISADELLTAKQAVMKSETALQFLLGGYSASWSDTGTGTRSVSGFSAEYTSQAVGSGLSGGGAQMGSGGAGMMGLGGGATAVEGASGGMGAAPEPASKFEEQLKQLSGPVSYDGMPVNDFAMMVTELLKVPVIVDHHSFDDAGGEMNFQITLSLKSDALTWKEVLTAVADTHDIGFIIRDYGILVTTQQKAAAQGVGSGFFGGLGGAGGGSGGGFF